MFSLHNQIIREYATFSRSFTRIRASDIKELVESEYAKGHFWPAPLIQIKSNFVPGGSVDALADEGLLHEECRRIFRIKTPEDPSGKPMVLHKHPVDAIKIAKTGESYVFTTGTGSGKSLAYFVPIVDDVLRRRKAGQTGERITAIVVYPMNALCNSQLGELHKFLELGYSEGHAPVTFARYTGQESAEERNQIAQNFTAIFLLLHDSRFRCTDRRAGGFAS